MKKQLIIFLSNLVIIFGCAGVCINFLPQLAAFSKGTVYALSGLSAPDYTADSYKAKFTSYISVPDDNNTTAPFGERRAVVNTAGSEDSDDGRDLTATPDDIAKLMSSAEKTADKSKAVGKTSEEDYFGGGRLISYKDIEIQSKIPEEVYNPDIRSLLEQDSDLVISDKSKPSVLVYHSHTTEAYALLDSGYYISSDARSKKPSRNVVRVGDELVAALESAGYSVIHDTEIHDTDYNSSYEDSRKTVEKYLEEYPSIEITIDLHRDDITYDNKTKVKPTAVVNGKKAARMMLIAGCEYGLVKNYPDWEYNLRFDLRVQQEVNALYPGLMRPILFSQRKYNMYETHTSFLLEVGTDANTLDEACYSARLFGTALAQMMERYVK